MSWKHGIIAAFAAFALMMAFFMYKMSTHKSNYVPKGYYEKGNHYQETINATEGASVFQPYLGFNNKDKMLIVGIDSLAADSGNILVQWPPDPSQNKAVRFQKLVGRRYTLELKAPLGSWNVKMEFYAQGVKYMYSKKIWVE